MPRATEPLLAGVYRHYKGHFYEVLGYCHDADDEQRVGVVYIGLELDEAHHGPRLAVRNASTFLGWVCGYSHELTGDDGPIRTIWCGHGLATQGTGCPNHGTGNAVKRFDYVGADW